MGAEQAKQTANEVVELTDRALHAVGPMGEYEGKRDFDRHAKDLAYLGSRMGPTLDSIAANLENSRVALYKVIGFNLLAADAINGMPVEEVSDIEKRLTANNAAAQGAEKVYINPIAGELSPARAAAGACEGFAGHLRQAPNTGAQEGSWTWLFFAYRVLKRVARAL